MIPEIPTEPTAAGPFVFDGKTYDPELDEVRLGRQVVRVFHLMRDGAWRTLAEIGDLTGDPQASISARLRDYRKPRYGFVVERRRRNGAGTYEYRLSLEERDTPNG